MMRYRIEGLRLALVLILFLSVIMLVGCSEKEPIYIEGIYSNSAEGYYSTLIVEIVVDPYNILSIEVLGHEEPQILADEVFKRLIPEMIKKNTYNVDAVSGASYTSKALKQAVEKALEEAKVSEE